MAAASPEGREIGPDETTLADEEWPVSDLYRVDPAKVETGTSDARERLTRMAPTRPRSRLPFDDPRAAALALVLLAAVVVAVAAGWYVANGGEPEAAPPAEAATGGTAPNATGTDTTPSPPPAAATREVPDVAGVDVEEARDVLGEAGLRWRVRRWDSDDAAGTVTDQHPEAGSTIGERGVVTLIVSTGPVGATVPDVVGEPASMAMRELREAGLRVVIERVPSS